MPTNYSADDNRFLKMTSDADDVLWELLSVYVDGEATPEQAAQVEALLRTDPAYARDFEFLRMTADTVMTLPEVEPPAALRESIFAATTRRPSLAGRLMAAWIDLRHHVAPQVGRYMLPVGGLAAAMVVGVVLWPYIHTGHGPSHGSPGNNPGSYQIARGGTPTTSIPSRIVRVVPLGTHGPDEIAPVTTNLQNGVRVPDTLIKEPPVLRNTVPTSVTTHPNNAGSHGRSKPSGSGSGHPGSRPQEVGTPPSAPSDSDTGGTDGGTLAAMDSSHFRPVAMMDPNGGSTTVPLGDDVQPRDDFTSAAPRTAAVETDTTPKAQVQVADAMVTPTTLHGHLILPPDARHILTGADIKRERDAALQGYNRETLENIQRHEATLSLVSKF